LDLRDASWLECRRLHHTAMRGAALAALDGRLHLVGGYDAEADAASAHHHCYDPVGDEWHERAPLPTPRALAATAVLNGTLFAIGGTKTAERDPLAVVESYSHRDNAWSSRPPLPHALCDAAAAASDGRIHVFGGLAHRLVWPTRVQSAATHIFSPSAEQWIDAAPLLVARSGAQVARSDDRLYVVGGRRADGGAAPVEAFAPSTGRWLEAPQPKLPRTRSGVVALGGVLYVMGGVTADGPARSIEACKVEHIFHVHRRADAENEP
jgi:kelch-like protein 19